MINFPQGFINNYGHPLFEGVANEISNNLQVDQTMVIGALLPNISLALQASYDFEGLDGRTMPCSLLVGVEAGPTRGKNSIMSRASSPIREFENERRQEYAEEMVRHLTDMDVWNSRNESLRRKLARAQDKGGDIKDLTQALHENKSCKPSPPEELTLVFEDATYKALAKGFHSKYRSLGVMSSEGGIVTKSDAFRRPDVTAQLWSGEAVAIDTVRDGQVRLKDVRASWLLMAQPEIWRRLIERDGGLFMATGASARMLMFRDLAPAGWQPLRDAVLLWPNHERYAQRLKVLMHEGWERSKAEIFARKKVRMTQEAHRQWMHYRNWVISPMQPGGRFERVPDHAARLGENVARIATIIHVLEGIDGDIRENTVRFAIDLAEYCSSHYLALFVPAPPLEVNAAFLENWLYWQCQRSMREEGKTYVSARKLRGDCPSRLRGKDKSREPYDQALQYLIQQGRVRHGYHDGAAYLDLSYCMSNGPCTFE